MDLEALIRQIAREEAAKLVAASVAQSADRLPHNKWGGFPSPREACEAARAGRVRGAVKVGRRWYATRLAIEEYIAANAEKPAAEADNIVAIVDRVFEGRRRHG